MNASLIELGLSLFFTQQLTADELDSTQLARVSEVHRSTLKLSTGDANLSITLGSNWYKGSLEDRPTVGDWVVLDGTGEKLLRILERKSLFKRLSAGSRTEIQLVAANVDTLFIVSSCNEDFNESRLERYLSLCREAGADAVVVLTKADLAKDPETYRQRVSAMQPDLPVELVNALEPTTLQSVKNWVTPGSTVALAGSSGVGKSTLVNSLSGDFRADTGGIREHDAKGRHTTTSRSLHQLSSGGILIDLPGMRELKVVDVSATLDEVFDDIDTIGKSCKFRDCLHGEEPGCAVQAAIADGSLDARRLTSFQKLLREDAHHTATLAERREADRQFGKKLKQHISGKRPC